MWFPLNISKFLRTALFTEYILVASAVYFQYFIIETDDSGDSVGALYWKIVYIELGMFVKILLSSYI